MHPVRSSGTGVWDSLSRPLSPIELDWLSASPAHGDLGLAADWSMTQLLGSDLPIRFSMRTVSQRSVVPSLALIALGVGGSPQALIGQLVSARPASISLTVVVPPRPSSDVGIATEGKASLVGATPTAIDLEAIVGLVNRPAARIEVRLGPNWNADSTRVWVRNRRGEFERLLRDASIVALDAPQQLTPARSPLHFRVESSQPIVVSALSIPLEYRVTVGSGDEFSVWSFASLLRLDSSR